MKCLFLLLIAALAVGCDATTSEPNSTDIPDVSSSSVFWDGTAEVHGSEGRFYFPQWSFEGIAQASDAVVEVQISSIDSVELSPPIPDSFSVQDPADQAILDRDKSFPRTPLKTTYSGTVVSWIRGQGDSSLLIRGMGGDASDGTLDFPDGSFLLEPNRTYVLVLYKDLDGVYEYGFARSAFDVTEGVKVFNHEWTRDLEHFEKMSVDEFVGYVSGIANADAQSD